jgi:hypothetical protein
MPVWQPSSAVPPNAPAFLHALAEDAQLADWTARRPDPAWVDWLAGQGLAAYACYRLRRAGAFDCLPPDLAQPLAAAYYRAAADSELHTRELVAVLDALAAAGITPILFKGAALAHLVYPDPACRPMGDLDLWLAAAEMPAAVAVLQAAGYRRHGKDTRPLELQAGREGEIQLAGAHPGQGLVELHYGVFAGEWLHRTAAVDSAGLAARAVPVTVVGRPAATLAPEDAVIQLAVHLAVNHQMAYPGVRALLDVCLVARSGPLDWAAVSQRARDWRVRTAVWQVLSLADGLLGLPGVSPALAVMQPSRLRRHLLARFVNPGSILAGRDLTHGRVRFIYQLLLADQPRDAARLLARALWPEDAWLAARYGHAGWRIRVAHLLAAVRGRI